MYIMLIILLMDVSSTMYFQGSPLWETRGWSVEKVFGAQVCRRAQVFLANQSTCSRSCMTVLFITLTSIITIILTTKTMTKTTLSYGQVRSKWASWYITWGEEVTQAWCLQVTSWTSLSSWCLVIITMTIDHGSHRHPSRQRVRVNAITTMVTSSSSSWCWSSWPQ